MWSVNAMAANLIQTYFRGGAFCVHLIVFISIYVFRFSEQTYRIWTVFEFNDKFKLKNAQNIKMAWRMQWNAQMLNVDKYHVRPIENAMATFEHCIEIRRGK